MYSFWFQAILSRKLNVPEVLELIKKVEDMSITADSPLIRRECRQVSGPVTFSWWCPIHSNLVINFRQLLCSSYEFNMMFVWISNYKMCVFYFYVNLHIRLNFCYANLYFILQIALQYILEYPLGKLGVLRHTAILWNGDGQGMLATIFSSFPQVFLWVYFI